MLNLKILHPGYITHGQGTLTSLRGELNLDPVLLGFLKCLPSTTGPNNWVLSTFREPSFSLLPWALECSLCSSYTLTQNSDSRSLALQRNTELLENCCLTVVIIIEDDSPIHWHLYYLLHLYPYEGRDLKGNILDRSSLGSAMVFVSFLPSNPGPCVDSAHTSALNCTPPAQQVREYFYS